MASWRSLEVDQFHHILLPWPAALEVALNSAIHAASVEKYGNGVKLAPARRLRRILKEAGFGSVRRLTYPLEWTAPFDIPTREFLEQHIEYLRSFAYSCLPKDMQVLFDEMTNPKNADSLQRSPDAELECMNVVFIVSMADGF